MRNFVPYTLAAFVMGLALNFVAPAAPVSLSTNIWPNVDMPYQTVNRTGKSDRLPIDIQSNRNNQSKTVRDFAPAGAPTRAVRPVPEGCDPAFSPLSASARLNYPSRCLADSSDGRFKAA